MRKGYIELLRQHGVGHVLSIARTEAERNTRPKAACSLIAGRVSYRHAEIGAALSSFFFSCVVCLFSMRRPYALCEELVCVVRVPAMHVTAAFIEVWTTINSWKLSEYIFVLTRTTA